MLPLLVGIVLAILLGEAQASTPTAPPAVLADMQRLTARAARVTIIRDHWGIAHVYGRHDADTVFGLLFAQAEDDFPRVERNYIKALGRLAEVDGEAELVRDLRTRLYSDPVALQRQYAASPPWLKLLMNGFADGLNFYLLTHPQVKPSLITKFEPWMALAFSEGSIGGDIESINLDQLAQCYAGRPVTASIETVDLAEPIGSNGFALAPSISASGHALLLINPHTPFYFRNEVHMVSEHGLNAYGALAWGQFFVYQGFNARVGWMHTSGGANVVTQYLEKVRGAPGHYVYRYDGKDRVLRQVPLTLKYRVGQRMLERTFITYRSHHGPVIRRQGEHWVTVRMLYDPARALAQSYLRTKANNYAQFYRTMEMRTNSSNNTVYADADGTIAFFNGNFVPVRDTRFNWNEPVDGSVRATEWQGLHRLDDIIALKNPAIGWLQNTNNTPFSSAGSDSPKAAAYPAYMLVNGENARGVHARSVLTNQRDVTLDTLIAAASDNYLTAFETLLPALLAAYDGLDRDDRLRVDLAEQVLLLRSWDLRYSVDSVATSLAVFWGQALMRSQTGAAQAARIPLLEFMEKHSSPTVRLQALVSASAKLESDFGNWRTAWGEINRFQRLDGGVTPRFDDQLPSLPVASPSATWGTLSAFGVAAPGPTRRIYGDRGNSFVAVVEFGPRLRAKSILAGGTSGDPASRHFSDQAQLYSQGQLKDVYFYRDDIEKHQETTYQPGRR